MKIKIKVKTIIIIFILIVTVVPFVNLTLAEFVKDSKPEIAEKLYDYYLSYPTSFQKDEVLYKRAEVMMGGFSRYLLMMGMRMGERRVDNNTIDKVIDSYEKIIEDYPKSEKYTLAYKNILDSYIYKGDMENLERWIEWGKSSTKDEINSISILYEGYVYFVNREYTEAEDILDSFILGNKNLDYMYYFLRGHIEFAREDLKSAIEYYEKASEVGWRFDATIFGSLVPNGRKVWLEELDFKNGENKIRGRVTSDGVGVPFVEVYLQKTNQGYSTSGIDFIAITDRDGYYETIGVKDGKYDLGIGIGTGILFEKAYLDKGIYNIEIPFEGDYDFKFKSPMTVINPKPNETINSNKFEVEWEPVEGADYYTVQSVEIQGAAVMTVGIRDENKESKIRGNKGIFDIDIIKNSPTGYSRDENDIVSSEAITGYLYQGKTTPIIVNAYDKNGAMVGSSVTLASYYENIPSIKIEGELTEGEKLIVKQKYEEAVIYYENLLLDDENNIEALSYLSKLYIFGWGKGTVDVDKAIGYGRKVYDIKGDADIILGVLNTMTSKGYRENKEIAKEVFDIIPDEYRDSYFYWYRGEYYRALGEFQKSREDFSLADNINDLDIVYMDIYLGEYERAIDLLKNEDTKLYFASKSNLIKGIEGLKSLNKDNEEYLLFREYLSKILKRENQAEDIEEIYKERREVFNKVYRSIRNPSIKIILNEIKIDNSWD